MLNDYYSSEYSPSNYYIEDTLDCHYDTKDNIQCDTLSNWHTINDEHLLSLATRNISEPIARANFYSIQDLSGQVTKEKCLKLLYPNKSFPHIQSQSLPHLIFGGLWCQSLTGWGQLKPNNPRMVEGKKVKYESPRQVPTGIYLLKIDGQTWKNIADRYGVKLKTDIALDQIYGFEFWEWVLKNPKLPVAIAESAFKAASLLTSGRIAIGLPSVYNWSKKLEIDQQDRELHSDLKSFCSNGRKVTITFDQDEKLETIHKVNIQIRKFTQVLIKNGCQVFRLSWSTNHKGIDDYLGDGHDIKDCIVYPLSDSQDVTIEQNSRYFELTDEIKKVVASKPILFLKGQQGTGKTQFIADYCDELQKQGQPVYVISTLRTLVLQLCQRLGIPYRTDEDLTEKHWLGYGSCIDSHREKDNGFNPDKLPINRKFIVTLDELEQILHTIYHGNTEVKKYRKEILATLEKTIALAIKYGQLICADADLSNLSFDFIRTICNRNSLKFDFNYIVNTYQAKFSFFSQPNSDSLYTEIIKDAKQGKRLIIAVASQKVTSNYSTQTLEAMLGKLYGSDKVVRIDHDTVKEKDSLANKVIENVGLLDELGIMVLLYSPSVGTGFSIPESIKFDKVFACDNGGVLTPEKFVQFLWRYRGLVQRSIYVPKMSVNKIGNGSFYWFELAQDKLKSSSELSRYYNDDGNLSADLFHLEYWGKTAARVNQSKKDYRESIENLLKSQGHTMLDESDCFLVSKEEKKMTRDTLKQNKEQNLLTSLDEIVNTPDMTKEQYDILKRSTNKLDKPTLNKIKRYELKQVSGNLWDNPDKLIAIFKGIHKGLYGKIRWLGNFSKDSTEFFEKSLDKRNKDRDNNEYQFIPDLVNRDELGKKLVLDLILKKVNQLGFGDIYTPDDERFLGIKDTALKVSDQLLRYWGIKVTADMTPRTITNKLLRTIGLRLVRQERIQIQGKRQWQYYIDSDFEGLSLADLNYLADYHSHQSDATASIELGGEVGSD